MKGHNLVTAVDLKISTFEEDLTKKSMISKRILIGIK
jgi:hypothetical protein